MYLFIPFLLFLISCQKAYGKETSQYQDTTDQCSFQFEEFHSPLEAKSKNFKTINTEKRDDAQKTVQQSAVLSSGEYLHFSGGGCAHFAFSFTYSKLQINKKLNALQFIHLSISLLKKTAADKSIKNILTEALTKAKRQKFSSTNDELLLSCGDAVCKMSFSNAHKLVTLSYDFAL